MNRMMKVLAIAALLVTLAGAGTVLYGLKTMTPQVQQVSVSTSSAEETQEVFDSVLSSLAEETFTGRMFGDTAALSAQSCTFLTYSVRVANRGFFPAEWIELTVIPGEGDVLQLPGDGGRVLTAGSVGDLSATLLVRGDGLDTRRTLQVSCYVFGRKIAFQIEAN